MTNLLSTIIIYPMVQPKYLPQTSSTHSEAAVKSATQVRDKIWNAARCFL